MPRAVSSRSAYFTCFPPMATISASSEGAPSAAAASSGRYTWKIESGPSLSAGRASSRDGSRAPYSGKPATASCKNSAYCRKHTCERSTSSLTSFRCGMSTAYTAALRWWPMSASNGTARSSSACVTSAARMCAIAFATVLTPRCMPCVTTTAVERSTRPPASLSSAGPESSSCHSTLHTRASSSCSTTRSRHSSLRSRAMMYSSRPCISIALCRRHTWPANDARLCSQPAMFWPSSLSLSRALARRSTTTYASASRSSDDM
mmetsp:Transcript_2657/g.10630  ORF Transcript_2657/g.10630 Transcript_2657/m.10630 type:complete len:262 (-) Transcript_2657:1918-2703(-)